MVMTPASHAGGPAFESRLVYTFLFFVSQQKTLLFSHDRQQKKLKHTAWGDVLHFFFFFFSFKGAFGHGEAFIFVFSLSSIIICSDVDRYLNSIRKS